MKKTIIFILFILISSVFASNLPIGLIKAQEENQKIALNYLNIITIAIAFLAGMTSILSPCILPLLPAFFSYTFITKKNIAKMTLIFFAGFALSFISLGLIAAFFFKSTLFVLQDNLSFLVRIFGLLLIIFGVLAFLGFTFPGFKFNSKIKNSYFGVFLYGIIFAFGWSACLGPILAGVILMVSTFNNYFTAFYLMLFYSLGIFFPLFLLSIYFDKSEILRKKIFTKEIKFIGIKTHITKLISGIMFIFIGILFFAFGNTSYINSFSFFGLKNNFYSLQDLFLKNYKIYNIIGIILLIIFIFALIYFIRRRNEK